MICHGSLLGKGGVFCAGRGSVSGGVLVLVLFVVHKCEEFGAGPRWISSLCGHWTDLSGGYVSLHYLGSARTLTHRVFTQASSGSFVFSVLSGPVTCADSHLETVSGQLTETGRVREVFSLT